MPHPPLEVCIHTAALVCGIEVRNKKKAADEAASLHLQVALDASILETYLFPATSGYRFDPGSSAAGMLSSNHVTTLSL